MARTKAKCTFCEADSVTNRRGMQLCGEHLRRAQISSEAGTYRLLFPRLLKGAEAARALAEAVLDGRLTQRYVMDELTAGRVPEVSLPDVGVGNPR